VSQDRSVSEVTGCKLYDHREVTSQKDPDQLWGLPSLLLHNRNHSWW